MELYKNNDAMNLKTKGVILSWEYDIILLF